MVVAARVGCGGQVERAKELGVEHWLDSAFQGCAMTLDGAAGLKAPAEHQQQLLAGISCRWRSASRALRFPNHVFQPPNAPGRILLAQAPIK